VRVGFRMKEDIVNVYVLACQLTFGV